MLSRLVARRQHRPGAGDEVLRLSSGVDVRLLARISAMGRAAESGHEFVKVALFPGQRWCLLCQPSSLVDTGSACGGPPLLPVDLRSTQVG